MKTTTLISILVLPLALVACQPEKTTKERMDAGADKVAEGMK